ncbi:MAG: class I SAM-dependent methyltransferase [Pseudomonadota bacterium]
MTLETDIARHYGANDLIDRIDIGLRAAGVDPAHPGFDALKPVDEFHTGGFEATTALLDQLDIQPEMQVLDIGCGLGGTARHILHRYGAHVVGVDLTRAYVKAGKVLNERLQLTEGIDLLEGSALDLPVDDTGFDLVTMFHVGMNIPDKPRLFSEVARVLRPGGHFALFDVMRGNNDEELVFPLPWSGYPEISHVEAPGVYRRAAHAAGLEEIAERDRVHFALDYFGRVGRKIAAEGLPPVGIHILMGDTAGEKIENYLKNLEAGRIAPTEMIFRHR